MVLTTLAYMEILSLVNLLIAMKRSTCLAFKLYLALRCLAFLTEQLNFHVLFSLLSAVRFNGYLCEQESA